MKRSSDWVFFTLVFLAVAAIAGSAGFKIVFDRFQAIRLADAKFESLKLNVKSASDMGGSISSKAFREQIKLLYERDESILGIIVRDARSASEYVIPDSSPFIATEMSSSGFRKDGFDGFHPLSAVVKGAPILLKDGEERWLEAAYVVLPAKAITDPLRWSLLGFLIIVFIFATVLIVLYSRGEPPRAESLPFPAPEPRSYEPPSMRNDLDEEEFSIPEIAADVEPGAYDQQAMKTGILDFPSASLPPLDADYDGDSGLSLPPLREDASTGFSAAETMAVPRGLFSERSGLGWEAYLEERLDAELERASSSGKDCALLLIALRPGEGAPTDFAIVARSIASYFRFKDLAFERGRDGFAVVLPGATLEAAMESAEDFLASIADGPWSRSGKAADDGTGTDLSGDIAPGPSLSIGATSLAGRPMRAAKLVEEAAIALEKASADKKTRVIGFRANADRYRDYTAGKL